MSPRIAAVIALLAILPVRARAQLAGSLDFGSGVTRVGASPWLRESRMTPTLSITHRLGSVRVDADAVERNGDLFLRRSSADGAVHSPAYRMFRATLAGSYLRDAAHASNPATSVSVLGAVSAKVGATGVWVGTSRPMTSGMQLSLGAWRSLRSAVVSVTRRTYSARITGPQTITLPDSTFLDTLGIWIPGPPYTITRGNATRYERWSDVEGRVDWSAGRLSLSGSVTGRRGRDSVRAMTWGRGTATLQVTSRMSLIAGGGTTPAAGRSGLSTSRFATIGLRLAPASLLRPALPAPVRPSATAIVVSNVAPGVYQVVLRVPSARTVEVSGDFNQWTPVSLREVKPNVWEVLLPMTPGVHRVNVRIDGDAWTAPPGLPATEDEFNGRVGILIVR